MLQVNDEVKVFNHFKNKEHLVKVTKLGVDGFFGKLIQEELSIKEHPWIGYEYYFPTKPGRKANDHYTILENVTEQQRSLLKPVYMDGETIKFNTTSLPSVNVDSATAMTTGILKAWDNITNTGNVEPIGVSGYPKWMEQDVLPEDPEDWGAPINLTMAQIVLGYAQFQDIQDILNEFNKAFDKYGHFASFHEGFAVMKEEVDELWDHVKTNESKRNKEEMRKEAIQVAAMALKIIHLFNKE